MIIYRMTQSIDNQLLHYKWMYVVYHSYSLLDDKIIWLKAK